ncbi:hypothetical protein GCM10010909_19920 [Acidocella aquatica]|uniref:SDR family oxidoreductase n=1 Tax=Acidocella aquatica TaxID=1922313 RepID=A0ABQ6A4D9_9PROT|nr:SDR family oxidoreductase [Acidocella aquatica]GLR67311.1 hypothetical protein GCM10010909_19920 [Acidocella aquatica]
MTYVFKPRVALITGGGSGIGAAMARELASRKTYVVVADIDLKKAANVSHEIGERAEAIKLDVTDRNQVEALLISLQDRLGSLDCLVNCAGINSYGEALDAPWSDWHRIISVNLMGTITSSMAAYAVMAKQGHGTIINMGSMATFLVDPLFAPYVTSKFGVVGFSRALGVEAEAYGIHVCVVCPGNILTPMRGEKYKLSWLTPAMTTTLAVKKILQGVKKRRRIIVFPFHAKMFWWLDRISPRLLNSVRREIFRRAKKRVNSN